MHCDTTREKAEWRWPRVEERTVARQEVARPGNCSLLPQETQAATLVQGRQEGLGLRDGQHHQGIHKPNQQEHYYRRHHIWRDNTSVNSLKLLNMLTCTPCTPLFSPCSGLQAMCEYAKITIVVLVMADRRGP